MINLKTILAATMFVAVTLMLIGSTSTAAFAENNSYNPRIKIREGISANWAGYASESSISLPSNNFVNSVKGSWIVPTLSCSSSNTYVATWVGIDGYSDSTVEQTGTEQDCINGVQQNYAWYEMYPHPSFKINAITIHSGDIMTASVTYQGGKIFTLAITDQSTGQKFSQNFKANGQRQSAEWIVEAPYSGGVLPLANFGTTSFNNAYFTDHNGITHAIDGRGTGTYDAITMQDPKGGVATPSALTDGGQSSNFTVTYSP